MARLFELTSGLPLPGAVTGLPRSAVPLIALLWRNQEPVTVYGEEIQCIDAPNSNKVVVGFSGGKDSLAVCLMLQRMGYEPCPVYVRGINKSYPHEERHAVKLCGLFGWKLRIVSVRLSGKTTHRENPVKNQLILGIQLDLALKLGTANIAQGNLVEDRVGDMNYTAGYSDGFEMFEAFRKFAVQSVPNFQLFHSLLKNETSSFVEIAQHPGALELVSSCMMPVRYKGKLHKDNELKYGVVLPPGRCGSCYKCADEYLHSMALNVEPIHHGFFMHCIDIIRRAWPTIYGKECTLSNKELIRHFVDETQVDLWRLSIA
jgi:7-cyano-7-deazaguanine synthase in queuosine biosynthesis